MKNSVHFLLYAIILLAFLPIILFATIVLNFKALILSKKYKVDYTAEKVMQLRCRMHLIGIRDDKESVQLYKALPVASFASLKVLTSPALITRKLSGYTPASLRKPKINTASILQYIFVRTLEFDRVLNEYSDQAEQIVVLGAGYDLRALKKAGETSVFELDMENIQQLKQKCLESVDIQLKKAHFIPADFKHNFWIEQLATAGFQKNKKTLFLWEGLASYLDTETVIQTLKTLKAISAPQSIIAFDFNSTYYNEAKGSFLEKSIFSLMKLGGRSFHFGIDTFNAENNVKTFLNSCNLDLKALSLIGKTGKNRFPFSGIIEART